MQAAAGFLAQMDDLPDLDAPPFSFPERYDDARTLMRKGVRTFTTTSMGRLFDAAAALLGFTREVSFEGQAAMWLEQLARISRSPPTRIHFRSTARSSISGRCCIDVASDRSRGRAPAEIARAFQRGIARGLAGAITTLCRANEIDTCVLSGGVFQNELLLEDLHATLATPPGRDLDESRRSSQRWRHQSGTGRARRVRPFRVRKPRRQPPAEAPMHELSIAMSIVELAEEESRAPRRSAHHCRASAARAISRAW